MDSNPHCRIGRVTFRNGTVLRVLDGKSTYTHTFVRGRFLKAAEEIHDLVDTMAAYVVVGISRDGSYSRGYCIGNGSPITETMLPGYIADVLRRDLKGTG